MEGRIVLGIVFQSSHTCLGLFSPLCSFLFWSQVSTWGAGISPALYSCCHCTIARLFPLLWGFNFGLSSDLWADQLWIYEGRFSDCGAQRETRVLAFGYNRTGSRDVSRDEIASVSIALLTLTRYPGVPATPASEKLTREREAGHRALHLHRRETVSTVIGETFVVETWKIQNRDIPTVPQCTWETGVPTTVRPPSGMLTGSVSRS